MDEILEFLDKAGTYYLATVEGDQPRVRPFGTVMLCEGRLCIQTGKVKPVSKQIAANPKVELCAFCEGRWIRVAVVTRQLARYPSLRRMYDEHDENTEVLYFTHGTATFSSFTEAPRTVMF